MTNEQIEKIYEHHLRQLLDTVDRMNELKIILDKMPKSTEKQQEIADKFKDLSLSLLQINMSLAHGVMEMTGRSFKS